LREKKASTEKKKMDSELAEAIGRRNQM